MYNQRVVGKLSKLKLRLFQNRPQAIIHTPEPQVRTFPQSWVPKLVQCNLIFLGFLLPLLGLLSARPLIIVFTVFLALSLWAWAWVLRGDTTLSSFARWSSLNAWVGVITIIILLTPGHINDISAFLLSLSLLTAFALLALIARVLKFISWTA